MSFGAYDDTKEQIRQSLDLADVIGGYMELRREGRHLVGLCPWHDDSRPSLQVNPERQSWKCWVCDVGGDLFSFVMRKEGVDFREALELLADRAGVTLSRAKGSGGPTGGPGDKRTLLRAAAWAEEQFHFSLLQSPEAEPVRNYLRERDIAPESIQRFRLGFSPNRSHWLLDRARGASISPEVLEAVGLVAPSQIANRPVARQWYDRFRGRWIFPIRDVQGRVIAFGGRAIPGITREEAAKYINSPETRLFSKSEQLYGLDLARDQIAKSRRITVMEGYTDVIMAWQHGLSDVVAVLGTALGKRHLPLIKRFADVVTLVLDGDVAGQRRTNEILELFVAEQMDLRILTLPDQLDPCDFLHQRGPAEFSSLRDQAVDALEHKIRLVTQGLQQPYQETAAANRALEEILRVLGLASGRDLNSALRLREQQILARLARQFHVSDEHLTHRLADIRRHRQSRDSAPAPIAPSPLEEKPVPWKWQQLPARDRELLEILSLEPPLYLMAREEIPAEKLLSEPARQVYALYEDLAANYAEFDFPQLLGSTSDSRLQSLLVDIDEEAQKKSNRISQSPQERLEELIQNFIRLEQDQDGVRRVDEIHRIQNAQEEVDLLREIVELTRQKQGLAAPTDG